MLVQSSFEVKHLYVHICTGSHIPYTYISTYLHTQGIDGWATGVLYNVHQHGGQIKGLMERFPHIFISS